MADYKEYKEFIPKSFEEKNKRIQQKGRKKAKILIVILNFILFPLNLNAVKDNNRDVDFNINSTVLVEDKVNISDIEKWFEIKEINYTSLNVKDGKGKIEIDNFNKINKLEELGFKINSLEEKTRGYEIEVSY